MYIAMHIADADPVWGPRLFLFTLNQHIRYKTASTPSSNTHRYAGGIAQIRLKPRITRHESRRPNPKVTGPRLPEANLQYEEAKLWVPGHLRHQGKGQETYERMFVFADTHTKNILIKCVSVLSSTATGRIPIR
jgi:hypothetical protein